MSYEPWIPYAKLIYGIILMLTFFNPVNCNPESDEIVSLPGQPPVNFKQFSGYITVDEAKKRSLFYYFVEAESDSASKPLVLWFNGGPGCSSLGAGAFVEHGPFKPSGNDLLKNDYSWNKEANMLYLESPAGVGFSYSDDKSFYTTVNDVMTAADNLSFLEKWLEKYPTISYAADNLSFLEKWLEKYPEYKNRDFYITGESYGGHYVPQLANLIVTSKVKINLKGIAIGNPLLDFDTDFNSRGEYLWSHGLISDATYERLNNVCNYSTIEREGYFGPLNLNCNKIGNEADREMGFLINAYDITLDICLSNVFSQSQVLQNRDSDTNVDVCLEDETIVYLNRKDVQTALHARLVGVDKWSMCSKVVQYDKKGMEELMSPALASLINAGIRVFVYSGDQDSVIPLTGTRTVVNNLAKQLGLTITLSYRAWCSTDNQVGGFTLAYGDHLSYATIRGASHEAPFSQPERSIDLFRWFLAGESLPSADDVIKKNKKPEILLF